MGDEVPLEAFRLIPAHGELTLHIYSLTQNFLDSSPHTGSSHFLTRCDATIAARKVSLSL